MSFAGREVQLLENVEKEELYPDFKPISPKRKSNILFADNSGNIHINFQEFRRKPIIKRRTEMRLSEPVSILGKRKLAHAFGEEIYNDQYRYGQEITPDFFKNNVGHAVPNLSMDELEIIDWCYKYLASKKK